MTLKQLRKAKGLTQVACAEYLKIPIRSYKRYEANETCIPPVKRAYVLQKLDEYGLIDEEHGVLTIEKIKELCFDKFKAYNAEYAYLFGSYAKRTATERSDVDLLVCAPITGIKFFGLVEELRQALNKRVDVLDIAQLSANSELVNEILKDGIKIYG